MAAIQGKQRIGDKQLGVLFDGGKVRRRREWRGVKDTLYDYGRWLYILSILAKFIVKPRNIKAMFRYRWMANYLAVPHMVDKFTMGLRDEALRIVHTAMDFVVYDVANTMDDVFRGDRRTGNDVEFSNKCVLTDENEMTAFMMGFPNVKAILREVPTMFVANLLTQNSTTHYLDVAQQFGIAGDVCPMPEAEAGISIDDDFAVLGVCAVQCNTTCDGSLRATASSPSGSSASTASRRSSSSRPCAIRRTTCRPTPRRTSKTPSPSSRSTQASTGTGRTILNAPSASMTPRATASPGWR